MDYDRRIAMIIPVKAQPIHSLGVLVEEGETPQIFTYPQDEKTKAYIASRYG